MYSKIPDLEKLLPCPFTRKQECLFGSMLGDIIGAGFEFKSPNQIKPELIANPNLHTRDTHTYFNYAGQYTDDFSQTLCVEECLSNPALHFETEMIAWSRGKYWAKKELFDIGIQTSKGIGYYRMNGSILLQPTGSGNGHGMRLAPLAFVKNVDESLIRKYCEITHNNNDSIMTANFYVHLLKELYNGSTCGKISSFDDYWNDSLKSHHVNFPKSAKLGNGYIYDTLVSIKHCMNNSTNTVEAITEAIKLGFDTDTTASYVGAVAGLYFGINDIPDTWLEYIQPSLQNNYVKNLLKYE